MWKKKWKQYGAIITAAVFLTVAGLSYGLSRKHVADERSETLIDLTVENVSESVTDMDTGRSVDEVMMTDETEMEQTAAQTVIFVHVCGEVLNPGVYELPEGSRIVDAVKAAGGLSEEASEESVNLAEVVKDGMQVVIPNRIEAEAAAKQMAESAAGLVNLNTATKAQLMELPGIGESKAEDIIHYRETVGGFRTIEEIMQVPGIKEAGFRKIKDRIAV